MSAALQPSKRGRMVVPPIQRKGRVVDVTESRRTTTLAIVDGLGNQDSYTRWAAMPENQCHSFWKPSVWTFHRVRVDSEGQTWSMHGGEYVMDDFGFLVKVPG